MADGKGFFRRRMQDETGLSVLLFLLVAYVFVVSPIAPHTGVLSWLLDVLFTLILVAANTALSRRRGLFVFTMALAVGAFVLQWWLHFTGSPIVFAAASVMSILFLGVTLVGILSRTLAGGHITIHRVTGSVACYLMLALGWAIAFRMVEVFAPGSFDLAGHGPLSRTEGGIGPMVYFSLVTITTLGYGDISPISPLACTLSTLEALMGQLFLVVLVARLVSMWSMQPGKSASDS